MSNFKLEFKSLAVNLPLYKEAKAGIPVRTIYKEKLKKIYRI